LGIMHLPDLSFHSKGKWFAPRSNPPPSDTIMHSGFGK